MKMNNVKMKMVIMSNNEIQNENERKKMKM